MIDIEKNRVYNIGEIETLKSSAINLLDTGIEACQAWDDAIEQLQSLQAKTPVKSAQLSSAICGAGKLYKSDYEVEKCWIEGALTNIITNIPTQDAEGVSLLEPLSDNLVLVKGMIEDLAGCIESVGSNQTLSEFQEKVEGLKQEWNETSLEENIEAFETSHLGMVENTSYSDDLLANYWFENTENGQLLGIQYFQNEAITTVLSVNEINAIVKKFLEETQSENDLSTKEDTNESSIAVEQGKIMTIPEPGEQILVSRGIELPDQEAIVSSYHAWSRLYSVEGCNTNPELSGKLCCRRLNYAIENYKCNSTENDLLMFDLEGYMEPVFAGAMVEGYANIGDIVEVSLDDSTNFHFLILDVKNTKHTQAQLSPNKQCQNEWGHGYMLDENIVQLNVCEFITAGNCSVDSAKYAESGTFLRGRRVVEAQIVDHIQICDE